MVLEDQIMAINSLLLIRANVFCISLLFSLLFILVSCVKPGDNAINIRPIDTLEIKIPDSTEYKSYQQQLVSDELINVKRGFNEIEIYDINEGILKNKINFEENSIKIKSVCYINSDSIFIITEEPHILILVNDDSKIINNWDLSSIYTTDSVVYSLGQANVNWPLMFSDNSLYLNSRADVWFSNFNHYPRILKINFEGDDIVSHKYFYYVERDTLLYFNDLFLCTTINSDNELIVRSLDDSSLFVGNSEGFKEILVSNSKYLQKKNKFDFEAKPYHEMTDRFLIKEPRTIGLRYDKYRNLYYKIYKHRQNLLDSNGMRNSIEDAEFSITFFDTEFNIIFEKLFKPNYYDPLNIFVNEKGLLISINNMKNPLFDMNYFKFELWEINYEN